MSNPSFRTEILVLEGGERFPLLVNCSTGLPEGFSTDYSIARHRGKPIATTMKVMASVGMLKAWAQDQSIDIDERFGTMRLFSSDEVTSLAEYLSMNRRPDLAEHQSVVGATQAARVDNVISYIDWRMGLVISSLPHDDPRVASGNGRLAATVRQLKKLKRKSVSKERGMLTEDQCRRLFEIVKPGSPENPFQKRTQLRNYMILLAYYELGIRRAEVLTLKGSHVMIGPRSTFHITFTPNDREDPRKDLPSIKTKSRLVPISRNLATAYEAVLKDRRSNPRTAKAAKKTAFVILSVKNGDPLSKKAVDDIFVVLRSRFPDVFPPDFAAHHLRRTWNYRYSKACEEAGLDEELADKMRRYLMGWSLTSIQPGKYNRAFIEEQAFKILLGMQNQMAGGTA